MSTITCGNCKASHGSVDEVKACYAGGTVASVVVEEDLLPCERKALETGKVSASTFTAPAATPKQVEFLTKLCAERPTWAAEVGYNEFTIPGLSKNAASQAIGDALKVAKETGKAEQATEAPTPDAIPAGTSYFAIDIDDTVKFYRVDRVTEGKWAGRTFIKVQASDEFHPIRNEAARRTILSTVVAQGVRESMARYGQLIGRCGCCGRTLTDETSRALGIGPVCRAGF